LPDPVRTAPPIVWLVLMRAANKVAISFEDHVRIVSDLVADTCAGLQVALPPSLQAGWSDTELCLMGLDEEQV
jgi:hypothetical protein